jgi:hemoglobin-like flavoprotein
MTTDADAISAVLEFVAGRGDITGAVYDNFLRRCPEGLPVMEPISPVVRGRMLGEILYAFMHRPAAGAVVDRYMAEEAVTHAPFGVTLPMYRALLDALQETVADCAGAAWTPACAQAWQRQADAMLAAVAQGLATRLDTRRPPP